MVVCESTQRWLKWDPNWGQQLSNISSMDESMPAVDEYMAMPMPTVLQAEFLGLGLRQTNSKHTNKMQISEGFSFKTSKIIISVLSQLTELKGQIWLHGGSVAVTQTETDSPHVLDLTNAVYEEIRSANEQAPPPPRVTESITCYTLLYAIVSRTTVCDHKL